jgi:hypothetical protein
VVGGPLIDFWTACLPNWISSQDLTLAAIASLACNYAAAVAQRYRGRIGTWLLSTAANGSDLQRLGEDELLWLTVRMAEAVRQYDPNAELVLGLAQPWGEYLGRPTSFGPAPRRHSAFAFADSLLRAGLNFAALDLELIMGVSPRGSYCRDLLDASRLLDLYALLGLPLQITLGLPSSTTADPLANQDLGTKAGRWRDGFTPEVQADWAGAFARLTLCKPAVRSVQWIQLDDAQPHFFPSCGLIDAAGKVKPALERLRQLRADHLR